MSKNIIVLQLIGSLLSLNLAAVVDNTDNFRIEIDRTAAPSLQPNLIRGGLGDIEIALTKPDHLGVSNNDFLSFNITGQKPSFRNSGGAKFIVIRIHSDWPTEILNVAEFGTGDDQRTLTIENKAGIICRNSSFVDRKVRLDAGCPGADVVIDGLRSPHHVVLNGAKVSVLGALQASDFNIKATDATIEGKLNWLLSGHIDVGNLINRGSLVGNWLEISSDIFTNECNISGQCGDIQVKEAQITARKGVENFGSIKAESSLRINGENIVNSGSLSSTQDLHLLLSSFLRNMGSILAHNLSMQVKDWVADRKGKISSLGTMTIEGTDSARLPLLMISSSQILSGAQLKIRADDVMVHRDNIAVTENYLEQYIGEFWVNTFRRYTKMGKECGDPPSQLQNALSLGATAGYWELCRKQAWDSRYEEKAWEWIKAHEYLLYKQETAGEPNGVIKSEGDIVFDVKKLTIDSSHVYALGGIDFGEDHETEFISNALILPQKTELRPEFRSDQEREAWVRLKQEDGEFYYGHEGGRYCNKLAYIDATIECHPVKSGHPAALPSILGVPDTKRIIGKVKRHERFFEVTRDGHLHERTDIRPIKPEAVKVDDQIVDLSKFFAALRHNQLQYQWREPAALPHSGTQLPSHEFILSNRYMDNRFATAMGTTHILQQLVPVGPGRSVVFAEPTIEQQVVDQAITETLGYGNFGFPELITNALLEAARLGLVVGIMPTHEQIQRLTMPILWPVKNKQDVLVPIMLLDALTVAESRASRATLIVAKQIDLATKDDLYIKGLIEATGGRLRLQAKNIYKTGKLISAGDVDLLAKEDLFLESLHDAVFGVKDKGIEAKGHVGLHAGRDVSIKAEHLEGGSIRITAGNKIAIVPKERYEQMKREWGRGTEEIKKKMVDVNNFKTTQGNLDFHAGGDIKIEGGFFGAEGDIALKSINGKIEVKPVEEYFDQTSESSSSSLFHHSTNYARYYKSNILPVQFSTKKGTFKTKSLGDTDLVSVLIKARNANMQAGVPGRTANINISSAKSIEIHESRSTESKWGIFFSGGGIDFARHTNKHEGSEQERSFPTIIQVEDEFYAYSEGKFVLMNSIIDGDVIKITAPEGIELKAVVEKKTTFSKVDSHGIGYKFTANLGELSVTQGVFGGRTEEGTGISTDRVSALHARGGISLNTKGNIIDEGAVIEGGRYFNFTADRFLSTQAGIRMHEWSNQYAYEIGVKVGVKSSIPGLVKDVIDLGSSNVDRPEDGINAGFKSAKVGIGAANVAAGGFGQYGAWGHASYQQSGKDQTHVFAQEKHRPAGAPRTSYIKSQFVFGTAREINFQGKDLEVGSAEIKADKYEHSAFVDTATGHSWHAGGEISIPIPIPGTSVLPSVSINGGYTPINAKSYQNSKITGDSFKGKFKKAKFEGVTGNLKQIDIEADELIVKSVQDEIDVGGFEAGISLDPTKIKELVKSISGFSGGIEIQKKRWIAKATQLFGSEKAKFVVKGVLKIVGAQLGNIARDKDGNLIDKGKAFVRAEKIETEDSSDDDFGINFKADVSPTYSKMFPSQMSGKFSMHYRSQTHKATIGQGDVQGEGAEKVHRDIGTSYEKGADFEIKPIEFYVVTIDIGEVKRFFGEQLPAYFKSKHKTDSGEPYERIAEELKKEAERASTDGQKDPDVAERADASITELEQAEILLNAAERAEKEGKKGIASLLKNEAKKHEVRAEANKQYLTAKKGKLPKPEQVEFQQAKQAAKETKGVQQDPSVKSQLDILEKGIQNDLACGDIRGTNEKLNAYWSILSYAKGFVQGVTAFVKDEITGTIQFVLHPIDSVAQIAQVLKDIPQLKDLLQAKMKDMADKYPGMSDEAKAAMWTTVGLEVLASVVPGANLNKLAKAGKLGKAVEKVASGARRMGEYIPAPEVLKAFPHAKEIRGKTRVQGGGKLRERWKDNDGYIYEWDSRHGAVEKYNKRGRHLGEFDPDTGLMSKPADPTRRIEP